MNVDTRMIVLTWNVSFSLLLKAIDMLHVDTHVRHGDAGGGQHDVTQDAEAAECRKLLVATCMRLQQPSSRVMKVTRVTL